MKISWHSVFLLAVAAAVLWLGYAARAVVTPLLAALLLAYVLDPIVRRLQRLGLSRNVASGLTVALAFVALVGGATLTATRLAVEGANFYHDVVGEPSCAAVNADGTPVSREEAERVLAKDLQTDEGTYQVVAATWDERKIWFVDQDRDEAFRPGYARKGFAKIRSDLASNDMTKDLAERLKPTEDLGTLFAKSAGSWLSGIVETGRGAAGTLLGLLTLTVLFPIYLYYSLSQLAWVYDVSVRHLPAAHRDRVVEILGKVHATLSAFFRGRLILLLVRLVILLALFTGFGIPFAAVCAVFGAIASLVPVLGPVVGASVPILLSISSGSSSGETLGLAAGLVALEAVDNYVLTPAILGKRVGLHPLTILVATFVAGDLLGIFGMLVAIPLTAVLKILAIEFVLPEVRAQAGLPQDGDAA